LVNSVCSFKRGKPIAGPGHSVLPTEKLGDGGGSRPEAIVRVLRRLLFVTRLLSGLAFAVLCYAEMLGVVRID
jgi:hypothetical protein